MNSLLQLFNNFQNSKKSPKCETQLESPQGSHTKCFSHVKIQVKYEANESKIELTSTNTHSETRYWVDPDLPSLWHPQVGGLPVPWIQRLPVPVWVRWLQTLQRLLRLPASGPVHSSYQGHAVQPERMLQPHLRQQVNVTCWPPGAVVATQPAQIFTFSKRPLFTILS